MRLVITYPGGDRKKIWADRDHLMKHMGYRSQCCLLDEVQVEVGASGSVERIIGKYRYDVSRSTYFEHHVGQLFPGFGGDCEFAAQTAAASAILTGNKDTKVLLDSADAIRIYRPISSGTDLICIAYPVFSEEQGSAQYRCKVYRASQYSTFGEEAKPMAEMTLGGRIYVPKAA